MIMKSGQQLCFGANLYTLFTKEKKNFENDEYKEKQQNSLQMIPWKLQNVIGGNGGGT